MNFGSWRNAQRLKDCVVSAAFSAVGLIILGIAFIVLVITFFSVARILAMRREAGGSRADDLASADGEGEDAGEEAVSDVEAAVPAGAESEPTPEEEKEEEERVAVAMAHGSNFGLILGILACLLFKVSWLFLLLSAAGVVYSGRSLWHGIRRYRIVILRALIGLVLSLASVGLHFLNLSGQLPEIIPFP